MFKKTIGLFIVLCLILGAFPQASFAAKNQSEEINAVKTAIDEGAQSLGIGNNTTIDKFLDAIKSLIPEENEVEITIDNPSEYKIQNATETEEGSIYAKINLEYDGLRAAHTVNIKIPKVTVEGKELNMKSDAEMLYDDKMAVENFMKSFLLTYEISTEEFLSELQKAAANGSKLEWKVCQREDPKNRYAMGYILGKLQITYKNEKDVIEVVKIVGWPGDKLGTPSTGDDNKEGNTVDKGSITVNFTDVPKGAYYEDAVNWAIGKKITSGTTETTFSPDDVCTNAQILTFIYRAAGSPKPTVKENPFIDVKPTDYYYNAALWAYEMEMTEVENVFGADVPCTRGLTAFYLWVSAGFPFTEKTSQFSDVDEENDFAEAISWAVKEKVAYGTSANEFSPDEICSRAQIVTFLKRAVAVIEKDKK